MNLKPTRAPPDRTALYVLALVGLIALAVVAYTAMEIVHPGGPSAEIVARISAIVVPATVALAAVMQASAAREVSVDNSGKIQDLHVRVDGRLEQLLAKTESAAKQAEIAARRDGFEKGKRTDPADPKSVLAGERSLDDADAKAAHVPLPDPPAPPHIK